MPEQVFGCVDTAIQSLAEEPRPPVSRKFSGCDEYRVRVGDYRIVYAMDDKQTLIELLRVAYRREVYRKR